MEAHQSDRLTGPTPPHTPGDHGIIDEDPTVYQRSSAWPLMFDWTVAGQESLEGDTLTARLARFLRQRRPRPVSLGARQFGRYVEVLRRHSGLTRPQLAQRAWLDPVAIAMLEAGLLNDEELSEALVSRVALALGVRRHELAVEPLGSPLTEGPVERPMVSAPVGLGDWMRTTFSSLRAMFSSSAGGAGWMKGQVAQTSMTHAPGYLGSPGGAEADRATLDDVRLPRPLALPIVTLQLPEAGEATAALVLVPPATLEEGVGDLLVTVTRDGHPLSGLPLVLDIDGLPFAAEAPTDEGGRARIAGVPYEPFVQVAERADAIPLDVERRR